MPERPALAAYLEGIDARFVPMVVELDRIIMGARPDLDSAIKYRLFMYGLHGRYKDWVCAIDARAKTVALRFLHGDQLDAPPGRLRPGSTTMGTLDLQAIGDIDAPLVAGLVRQAADLLDGPAGVNAAGGSR
jgi:hypothetical protein